MLAVLLQSQLRRLHQDRYVVVQDWLTPGQVASLKTDAVALDPHSGLDCAVVASGTDGSMKHDKSVRSSRQVQLYPPPSNAVGSVDIRASLIAAVNELRSELQSSTILALPHLEPFETELSYLLYPVGGHYSRHLDLPRANSGWDLRSRKAVNGGSFTGKSTRRVVSFILYLNHGWDEEMGGALRVFPAGACGDGSADSEQMAPKEDVLPEGGTLVLFMSSDVEHKVMVTLAERQCVVGWFRELHEERVPDHDAMSLRTPLEPVCTAGYRKVAGRYIR